MFTNEHEYKHILLCLFRSFVDYAYMIVECPIGLNYINSKCNVLCEMRSKCALQIKCCFCIILVENNTIVIQHNDNKIYYKCYSV